MKIQKISRLAMPVVALFISFNGCSNESENVNNPSGSEITVSGKVLNLAYQSSPNVTVQIGDKSETTSSDGSFSISKVTSPYNLKTIDGVTQTVRYYYGLTADNILIPADGSIDDNVKCEIIVTYPTEIVNSTVKGKIIFTDFNYVNSYDSPFQGFPLDVRLIDDSPVTGKLILITYKTNSSGKIISYENFGQSAPITVSKGGNYTYDFTTSELSLDPGEETISGSIITQPGFNKGITNYSITFSKKRTPNYSIPITFENLSDNNFSIIIPTNLPIEFSNLIFNYNYIQSLYNSEMFNVPSSSSGINLDTKSAPGLISPDDNAADVNVSTLFTFSTGSGLGIYQVNLIDQTSNKSYMIYSANNTFTLNDFKELFPDGISNMNFKWSVDKIGFANSMNEYVTAYTGQPEYFRNNSEQRSFTTAK